MNNSFKEIKCSHCNNWVSGNVDHCSSCGKPFYEKHKNEIEERKKVELKPLDLPIIKILASDPIPLKVIKYIIRFHQIIIYSIISYIVWASLWLAG